MQTNLGTTPLGQLPLGALAPRRQELTIDTDDAATVGFRADDGRSVTLFCTAAFAELREHHGRLLILARFAGGQRIACEDTGERLAFWIDGRLIFSMPRGPHHWSLYRA